MMALKRRIVWPLLLVCLPLLMLLSVFLWLVSTESGLVKLAQYATKFEPRLVLDAPRGRLFGEAGFEKIAWQQDSAHVTVTDARVQLSPLCALSLNVCARTLSAASVVVEIRPDSPEDSPREPIQLPTVKLPFEIYVGRLAIQSLDITRRATPDQSGGITTLLATEDLTMRTTRWQRSKLSFSSFVATLWGETFTAKGAITLADDYNLNAVVEVTPQQLPDYSAYIAQDTTMDEPIPDNLKATVSGSLQTLHASLETQGIAAITGDITLEPLHPQVPFSGELTIQQPVVLLANDQQVPINNATVSVTGDLKQLAVDLSSVGELPFAMGEAVLNFRAKTDYASLTVEQSELDSEHGRLTVNGQLHFDDDNTSTLWVTVKDVNPEFLNPQYRGRLNANAQLQISSLLSTPAATLSVTDIHGDFMNSSLSSNGSVMLKSDQQIRFTDWSLNHNNAHINIDGRFPNGSTDWLVNLPNVKDYVPSLTGQFSASGRLSGPLEKPSLNAKVKATTLSYQNYTAESLSAAVAINQLGWAKSTIDLQANSVSGAGRHETVNVTVGVSGKQRAGSAAAKTQSTSKLWALANFADIALALNVKQIPQPQEKLEEQEKQQEQNIAATLRCESAINLQNFAINGECNRLSIAINETFLTTNVGLANKALAPSETSSSTAPNEFLWVNDNPISFAWQSKPQHLTLNAFCLLNGASQLCVDSSFQWQPSAPGGLELSGSNLPLALLMLFLPDSYAIQGNWGFNASVKDTPASTVQNHSGTHQRSAQAAWTLQGTVRASNSTVLISLNEPAPLKVPIETLHASITGDRQGFRSNITVQSKYLGNIKGGVDYQQQAITGRLLIDSLDLQPLQALLPSVKRLDGMVSSDLTVRLADKNVNVSGDLSLTDFAFSSRNLPLEINLGQASLAFNKTTATLQGQADIGDGHANFTGNAEWPNGKWLANINMKTSAIRIEPLPHSYLNVIADMKVEASPEHLTLSGDMSIPKARIEINALPKNAVSVSDDSIIENQTLETNRLNITADVKTTLGKDVQFSGFGLKTNLAGALTIQQRSGQLLTGNGVVNLRDGRYRAYGQDLLIEEGKMIFAGPLTNPELLVTAVRNHTEDNVRVGVTATGPAKQPNITLFSNPALPEQHILYYLLTGKGPDSASGDQSRLAQQTAVALGLAQTNHKAGELANSLGIEDFQMTTDVGKHGEEAQFSGYITPDLYLLYGVSIFDQLTSITARYKISPDVYVEMYNSTSSAIDIFWSIVKE